jgi:hypothetical protein
MSFIIVHVPDPKDIKSYSCMPDWKGSGIEYFKTSYEAFECLEELGLEDEEDFKVLRVH